MIQIWKENTYSVSVQENGGGGVLIAVILAKSRILFQ